MNMYADAISSQSACNLSGIVRAFDRHVSTLEAQRAQQGLPADWLVQHPVSVLFVEQFSHLTGYSFSYQLIKAREICQSRADAPEGMYALALAAREVCDFGELAHRLNRVITQVWAEDRQRDTRSVNTHPACVLIVARMVELRNQHDITWDRASRECNANAFPSSQQASNIK